MTNHTGEIPISASVLEAAAGAIRMARRFAKRLDGATDEELARAALAAAAFGQPAATGDGPDAPLHRHNEVTEAVRQAVTGGDPLHAVVQSVIELADTFTAEQATQADAAKSAEVDSVAWHVARRHARVLAHAAARLRGTVEEML